MGIMGRIIAVGRNYWQVRIVITVFREVERAAIILQRLDHLGLPDRTKWDTNAVLFHRV
jgi:hypothetical protein